MVGHFLGDFANVFWLDQLETPDETVNAASI